MSRRFKELLLSVVDESPATQKATIIRALDEWRQDIEQTDDICIIGFRA